MPPPLPTRPSLTHLKNEAKALLRACRRGNAEACGRLRTLRRLAVSSREEIASADIRLHEAQYALALGYGFGSWTELKKHIESLPVEEPENGDKMSTMLLRKDTPLPFDHWEPWEKPAGLDGFRRDLVLSAFPAGSRIVEEAMGEQYAEYPKQYDRARVRIPGGEEQVVAVMWSFRLGGAEAKAIALNALGRLGFPVESLLTGPTTHPEHPCAGPLLVWRVSEPGGRYLPFIGATVEELDLTCRLLIEGVERLHEATEAVLADEASNALPRRTLGSELEGIVRRGGPWFEESVFADAVDRLKPVLEGFHTPLVFSNGYNYTWNFLCEGDRLTGFVGFDGACFEDPHMAFTTYPIWAIDAHGWGPFARSGLVERWLYRHNVSRDEFAPRLALRCLWRLQREVPVEGGEDPMYREHILKLLEESLAYLA